MTTGIEEAPANSEASKPPWSERIVEALIRIAGISVVIIVALIFLFLLKEGFPTFIEVTPGDLLSQRWYPIEDRYGILPLLVGSLVVTAGAVVIAVPLGLVTAIYLGEIAPLWQREILKPVIEILAGIPSIVLGFFGWIVLAPAIQKLGAASGLTAFTGSLILAYMSLPTIVSITEDALYAVPKIGHIHFAIHVEHFRTVFYFPLVCHSVAARLDGCGYFGCKPSFAVAGIRKKQNQ